MSKKLLACLGFSAALLVFGCGSNSDPGTSATSEAESKLQFVHRANAICERTAREKDRAVRQALAKAASTEGRSSRDDLEGLVADIVVPKLENVVGELADLTPPARDAETVGGIWRRLELALQKTKDKPALMLESNPFLPAAEAAAAYGLSACQF